MSKTYRVKMFVAIFLLVIVPGCYPSVMDQIATNVRNPNSPCQDPVYLQLKVKPLDQMTEREFELLKVKEQACAESKSQIIASAQIAKGAAHTGDVTIGFFIASLAVGLVVGIITSLQNK